MRQVGSKSTKDELWAEVQRLRQEGTRQRTESALLEEELRRLREGQALLEQRAEFVEELSGRVRTANEKLELLTSLTKELASFDLDGVLEVCVQRIPFLVGARYASVYLYDAAAERLLLKHHTHGREIDPEVDLRGAPTSLMALAVRRKEVLCIDDVERFAPEPGRRPVLPHPERYETRSCVIAPLVAAGQVQGVLNLADRFDQRPFAPEEALGVVRQACDLVAVSLRNARLFEEVQQAARRDSLTGVLNRQAFLHTLEVEIKRARRYRHPLAVLVVKLAGLRRINSSHGLQRGDEVLIRVAQLLRERTRDVDFQGRIAGTRFGVILPEQLEPGAMTVANRLAGLLAPPSGGEASPAEGTLGVAVWDGDADAQEFLARASAALEQATAAGQPVGLAPPPAPRTQEGAPPGAGSP